MVKIVSLLAILKITVQRFYLLTNISLTDRKFDVHGFSDASKNTYAAVVYSACSNYSISLVSKTCVSPLQTTSIPRLELMACLLLSELIEIVLLSISNSIDIKNIYCWSDSLDLIFWIQRKNRTWNPFIENRVIKIRKLVHPIFSVTGLRDQHLFAKLKVIYLQAVNVNMMKNESNYGIQNLRDISRFNDYLKLFRVKACVIRFVNNLKQKFKKQSLNLQFLRPNDIENAEFEQIRIAQKEFSGNESYFNQLKIKFGVFFGVLNILRCGGRLQFPDLKENRKNPVLLTKQSHFSNLVTLFSHLQTKHGGIKDTFLQVRSKYRIISIRQLVTSIIKKYFSCQRFESKPYQYPPSGSLPPKCSQQSLPFETTDVDYVGPVLVKPIVNDIDSNQFYLHVQFLEPFILKQYQILCALKRFI